jgi:predicted nucleotidyltransferase
MNEELLIAERDKLLSSVDDYFVGYPDVVGIFLGGSLPAGTADAYSDIDMRVVVTPDEYSRFV